MINSYKIQHPDGTEEPTLIKELILFSDEKIMKNDESRVEELRANLLSDEQYTL